MQCKSTIVNLISNGIKYSYPGGKVQLKVSSVKEKSIEISVTDDGTGIEPEALQDIFETGKSYILLTTSRTEEYREKTKAQLNDLNIPYNQLIMGLPHSKRVLINDYSNTNGYPSALSINLSRDKENLKEKLASLIDH